MSSTTNPWIKDVTDETFEQDVFETSRTRPVVVDFWAEWCQPCLMLKPVLEKAAAARDGGFQLAKCNTNDTPKYANEFGVQGIPAVYGVVGGEVVDFFTGVQPPEVIDQWLDRLTTFQQLNEATALESTDPDAAETLYRQLLDAREDFVEARTGLARALLQQDELEACRDELAKLQRRGFLEPEAEQVLSALHLREQADCDVEAVQAAAAADPDNLEAQVAWAAAQAGQKDYSGALDTLLAVIARQKDGVGEQARKQMIEIFRVLGEDNELTRDYRRRLSALLF